MTLGEMIKKLEILKITLGKEWFEREIIFSFCHLIPTTFASYRGYYDKLALGWKSRESRDDFILAEDLLKDCRNTVNKAFYGYKGGEFVMREDTEVFIDNTGLATGTIVKDIIDDGYWALRIIADIE